MAPTAPDSEPEEEWGINLESLIGERALSAAPPEQKPEQVVVFQGLKGFTKFVAFFSFWEETAKACHIYGVLPYLLPYYSYYYHQYYQAHRAQLPQFIILFDGYTSETTQLGIYLSGEYSNVHDATRGPSFRDLLDKCDRALTTDKKGKAPETPGSDDLAAEITGIGQSVTSCIRQMESGVSYVPGNNDMGSVKPFDTEAFCKHPEADTFFDSVAGALQGQAKFVLIDVPTGFTRYSTDLLIRRFANLVLAFDKHDDVRDQSLNRARSIATRIDSSGEDRPGLVVHHIKSSSWTQNYQVIANAILSLDQADAGG